MSVPRVAESFVPFVWPSEPPPGCPLEVSTWRSQVRFEGTAVRYGAADTWYPSWASDGHLYSGWTDGAVGDWTCSSRGFLAATGTARIEGDDPEHLRVVPLGTRFASPGTYGGRYPSAYLVKDGVWYHGTYCLDETEGRGLNWDVLGPFVGFRVSYDLGLTWEDCPHTPEAPLFGESGKHGQKVKIGSPHFVDFGRNQEHSPDGKAYLVAHGATAPDANLSWISGDHVYLARVDASPATINDPDAYEFYAGGTGDEATWSRHLENAQPIVDWPGHTGCVTITYSPAAQRFLMWVTDGWPTNDKMSSYVAESEHLAGPWRLVSYMRDFGTQAYFLNSPAKFLSETGDAGWLAYSANFTNDWYGTNVSENPPGSRYALALQRFSLL